MSSAPIVWLTQVLQLRSEYDGLPNSIEDAELEAGRIWRECLESADSIMHGERFVAPMYLAASKLMAEFISTEIESVCAQNDLICP